MSEEFSKSAADLLFDDKKWIHFLGGSPEAMKSFEAYLITLENKAKFVAVQPDTSEVAWRVSQAYYRLVLDMRTMFNNTMNDHYHSEAVMNGDNDAVL